MKYFTGKQGKMDTASKIKPTNESGEGMLEMLNEIYLLLEDSRHSLKNLSPTEEEIFERELKAKQRHKELIAALGYKTTKEETATKKEESGSSLLDDIMSMFGLKDLGKLAIRGLGSLATAAVSGAGGILLGGAAAAGIAYFMYKVLTDESSYDKDPNSPFNLALKQAERVGGLAGVKDEAERRKKLPEYDRTMAEIQDFETYQNEGEKLNDQQLQGYAKRGPGALEAVEDYKQQRNTYEKISGVKTPQPITTAPSVVPAASAVTAEPATGAPTAKPALGAPTAKPALGAPTAKPAAVMPTASVVTAEPAAVESIPTGQALSSAQSQNLDLNIPESQSDPSSVVNNTITSSNKTIQPTEPMPSVRNQEPTFADMILYSTRVV
jgi:hypothetical protein